MYDLITFFRRYFPLDSSQQVVSSDSNQISPGWRIQPGSKISSDNTTKYGIDQNLPLNQTNSFGFYNNKILAKVSIPANRTMTFEFQTDNNYSPNIDDVTFIADDFSDSISTTRWITKNSVSASAGSANIDATCGLKSRYQIPYSRFKVKAAGYITAAGSASMCRIAQNDEDAFIHDPSRVWDVLFWGTTHYYEWYSGEYNINVALNLNTWYTHEMIVDKNIGKVIYKINDSNQYIVENQTFGDVYLYLYSSTAPMKVTYVEVTKYVDIEPSVNISQTSDTTWDVSVTNQNDYDVIDYPISISLPLNNYKITPKDTESIIFCDSFPNDIKSSITYNTVLNRGVGENSNVSLCLHALIPNYATPGIVTLEISFVNLAVDYISDNGILSQLGNSTNNLTSATYNIEITQEMIGKHVVFLFKDITVSSTKDQTIVYKIERLADTQSDTFQHVFPILCANFIAEESGLGTQTIIV